MPMPPDGDVIEWPAGDAAARVLGATAARRAPAESAALGLAAQLYGAGVALRNAAFDARLRRVHHATVPVISVGNIVAGGAGKTPFTRWLVESLLAKGKRVAILHGGYRSDEPALHRAWLPEAIVIAGRDRVRTAAQAVAQGADVIVLDDAFQHRRLARDLDIVLMPVEAGHARLLPSGPLREPESALARADLIVVTRKARTAQTARALAEALRTRFAKPCAVAAIEAALPDEAIGGPVVAVASIARPDLFLANLRSLGVDVAKLLAYPDHYDYGSADAAHITRTAAERAIVTTEKDAVKLRALLPGGALRIVPQRVVIEEGGAVLHDMLEKLT